MAEVIRQALDRFITEDQGQIALFFLTLGKESRYTFGITSRSRDESAVKPGTDWLQRGLQEIGIGAKTSAGYGYWVADG